MSNYTRAKISELLIDKPAQWPSKYRYLLGLTMLLAILLIANSAVINLKHQQIIQSKQYLAKLQYSLKQQQMAKNQPNLIQELKQLQQQADITSQKQPHQKQRLEYFPITKLRLVGIIKQNQQYWGLIREPSGMIVTTQVGNYIGINSGKIIHIDDKQLIVDELVHGITRFNLIEEFKT